MTLTWPHINDLAAALAAAYPDVDRLSLTPEDLMAHLRPLLGTATPVLTVDEANAIRWQWMRLDDTPPGVRVAGEG